MKTHFMELTLQVNREGLAGTPQSVFIRVHPWLNCFFSTEGVMRLRN